MRHALEDECYLRCPGNLDRLVYGYDSYGFLCGTDNSGELDGTDGPDLREHKKLYYLNALELLNPSNFKSAKKICVKECPTEEDVCDLQSESLVCTESNKYRY